MNEKSSYHLNDSQKELCNNDSDYLREVKNESENNSEKNLKDENEMDQYPDLISLSNQYFDELESCLTNNEDETLKKLKE